ncbi:MadB family AAA-type ATPase [Antrihabitans cavernicola]|uniref:MoxR family ATPase n=1 Tax=Antrihabitans cavernicola TaxID=2495913 RepID=A0A5A7S3Y0_9NOCA|nr:MoxR family ATPase [Spelaeibacter cavernicola]
MSASEYDETDRGETDCDDTTNFESAQDLREALRAVEYIADDDLSTVVHLATALERPLLLEGPAGVGKTELAKALAAASGRRLIRLQCYEGLDDNRALYEWDYAKQLLHVQMLRDRITAVAEEITDIDEASRYLAGRDFGLYTESFLSVRPLLESVLSDDPVVLLIDEVDRTEESMEALLLEVLAEKQVTIPEIGTFEARSVPWVILTSNDTRELSAALKRRCLHFHLDFPSPDREREIVTARAPEVSAEVAADVVELARTLRELPLRKSPSISEVIDAARGAMVLQHRGVGLTEHTRSTLLAVLLKYTSDRKIAVDRFDGRRSDAPSASSAAPKAVRDTVAARPANTTTTAFRGRGGRDHGGIGKR